VHADVVRTAAKVVKPSGPILTFASLRGATFANVRIKGPLASYCF
jgi:hypothetical protein